ncbi:putative C6 transcription factor [Podospora didyma]|uniref:C6 transcription factor n=1 Tax=Podospora didyma TaxID=330526 RepID=A0AAE0N567_9PEZI|nr:putative C6 transcription factor [Podospora didyma]
MFGATSQTPEDHGPPPQAGPPPPTSASIRRYDVERSCIRCHERKVRCDKATPCMTCVRAKVSCRYPGPERTKRRSQKTSSANRLEVLERAVAAINSSPPAGTSATGPSPPAPGHQQHQHQQVMPVGSQGHTPIDPAAAPQLPPQPAAPGSKDNRSESEHSGGFLLKEGASTRYINEFTFSRVLDKQGELQSAIDTPESNHSSDGKQLSTVGFDGLFSSPQVSSADFFSLFPTRWQATQLWQMYLSNVDPLVKILHVPSVQPNLFAAINNPKDTPLDMSALLFSIYFAAVTSLRPHELQIILGQGRQAALNTYQRGLELSLNLGEFLDSPTITSLQAMALYLMCRRNSNSGRSGWILNGLLIRAAQSIGLHRDGEQFNLAPLDIEIRRRLWWQIMGSDGRVAEDHGLSAGPTGGYDGFCDTKLPTHIDDRDLSPNMPAPPQSQPRFTEMTHFLVASEMGQSLHQINQLSALNSPNKMSKLEQYLATVKTRMEGQYLQYCDINIPIQKCALLLGRLLLGKSEVFVRQQSLRGLNAEQSAARATEDMLALACDTIELGIEMKTDELLNNFQWLFSTFTDYHLLTYLLWHLCVRPETVGVDRAWGVVDRLFKLVQTQGWPTPGSKWNVLGKLREKAADIRHAVKFQAERAMARSMAAAAAATAADLATVPPKQQAPAAADLQQQHVDQQQQQAEQQRQAEQQQQQQMQQQQMDQDMLDAVNGTVPMFFPDGYIWDLDTLVIPEWGGYQSGYQMS